MGVRSWYMTWILLILGNAATAQGDSVELIEITDSTCNIVTDIYELTNHESYEIRWDGKSLPSYCKLTFIGRNPNEILDRYKVCVETTDYYVNDCTARVNYYTGFSLVPEKEYSCSDIPRKFCADENEYLDIEFKATSPSSSSVTLSVTAKKTYTYGDDVNLVAIICGALGGFFGLVAIIGVLIFIVVLRKRHTNTAQNQSMMMISRPPGNTTSTNTAGMPQGVNNYAYAHNTGPYPTQPVLQSPPMAPSATQPTYPPPPIYAHTG